MFNSAKRKHRWASENLAQYREKGILWLMNRRMLRLPLVMKRVIEQEYNRMDNDIKLYED